MPDNNSPAQAMGEFVVMGLSQDSKDRAAAFNPAWILLIGQIVLELLKIWRRRNPTCDVSRRLKWRDRDRFRRQVISRLNDSELAPMAEEIAHTVTGAYGRRNRDQMDRILQAYWSENEEDGERLMLAALTEVSSEDQLQMEGTIDGSGSIPVVRERESVHDTGATSSLLRKFGGSGKSGE